ncbi:hypothetical protein V1Y59_03420 [Gordonia sp. PKS22-38]|uniref:Ethanolamine utilization protein EutL n=1 Tax=Gordonia prachuapensis TaxID=3115651 RepID=A0ABU7MPC9_9ACTN|nr:hypothetical protein [Gordonia sp. PKS22-38]
MSTPHGGADEQRPDSQPAEPQAGVTPDQPVDNAPTEPITPAGSAPPNGPYAPHAPQQPMPPQQPNGVTDKVRNAVIAGGIGIAAVFGLVGFGAGYVVADSTSDQGPGMNMQRGGMGGPGGAGGYGQMPPGGSGGFGQMPGQQGQMPGQMPGQQPGQIPDQQSQVPGDTTQEQSDDDATTGA